MLQFSSELEYEVFRNGSAKVRERKYADNHSEATITVDQYFDTLPIDTPLDNIQCYRLVGDKRRMEICHKIAAIPGTDRKKLTITGPNNSKLQLFPGPNAFITEYDKTSFYFARNKVCAFYFHHSLPKIDDLRGKIIPKTIQCKIEKPFSRFFYYYALTSIHPPINYDESAEKDFSKHIELEFKFNLSEDSHYFNTIFITKELRIINLVTGGLKMAYQFLKKKFGGDK